MIPADGAETPKPPSPDPMDDETFEDRLRHAIVRHFRFAWRELTQAQQTERRQKTEPEAPPTAAASETPVQPFTTAAAVEPPPSAPPEPQGGNGSGPARTIERGPDLPPSRPPI